MKTPRPLKYMLIAIIVGTVAALALTLGVR